RLALVVTAESPAAVHARTADGVNLVDEDDARRVLAALGKEVAHSGRTDTDKHLDKFGAADAEKGDAGLAGGGLGEERLTRTGGTGEDGAARNLGTQFLKLLGLLQEAHKLHNLRLGLLQAGDVGKLDLYGALGVELLRLAL